MNETEYIKFKTVEEKNKKLKEWKLTKQLIYMSKGLKIKCNIIGYLSKKTNVRYISSVNRGCISPVYETLIIMVVDGEEHRIAIDYLKDMQKLHKEV